jgi:hypothetical protein
MTPTELRQVIDDLVLEQQLSLRISKGRALHLVICRLLERAAEMKADTESKAA